MKRFAHNRVKKEDLIRDIKKVYANTIFTKFTIDHYLKNGKYSKSPISTNGGWTSLLKEIGIPINVNYTLTKEQAIDDLIKIKNKYGTVSSTVYRKHGKYSQIIIDRLFGSYTDFVLDAGLKPQKIVRGMTDEEILEDLKSLYLEHGYINSSLIANSMNYTVNTIYNRFGTMANVYELLRVNNDVNINCFFSSVNFYIESAQSILNEFAIREWTCKELMNPENTNHLFVDAYFPNNNLIIEYDGKQHYEYTEFLHKSIEKFERTKILDKHKEAVINQLGIELIRFRYDEPKCFGYVESKLFK